MNMLLNYQPRTNFQHHQRQYSRQQQQQQQAQVLYPAQLDLGLAFDDSHDLASASPSLSSSPLSQYSIVSPSALSGVGAVPAISVPGDVGASIGFDDAQVNLSEPPELMQSEPWFGGHLSTKSGRAHHQRESSLSSLGSAGPASPFNPTISNPHIAVTDPGSDGFHDVHAVHDNSWHYAMPKPMTQQDHLFPGYQAYGAGFDGASTSDVGFSRPRSERGIILPPPDPHGATSRSHPGSVASSTFGGDSPATPSLGEPDLDERRRRAGFTNVPKLDRTMTDVYGDELYSPNFTITSASPSNQTHVAISPTSELFAQRLQAANSQHLSATHSPISVTSSDRSPFRQGSPFAPALGHDFGSGLPSRFPPTSAQRSREQNAIVGDGSVVKRHQAGEHGGRPQTISPKDAVLEFSETDGDANFPLFPQEDTTNFNNTVGQLAKTIASQGAPDADYQSTPGGDARYQYIQSQLPPSIQVPQQYPFIARAQPSQGSTPRLASEPSTSESSATPTSSQKPTGVSADGGTYTCTYHGCTQRFESPALLQKHKREGHRQAHGLNAVRRGENGAAPGALGSQAGPHRCDRINPSTGKSCNTIFSRPYDLTRHEDTIHNARKQKVRCDMCTEEKTFSRADALTRHYRVCHPDVEFPGKHRRRGGQGG